CCRPAVPRTILRVRACGRHAVGQPLRHFQCRRLLHRLLHDCRGLHAHPWTQPRWHHRGSWRQRQDGQQRNRTERMISNETAIHELLVDPDDAGARLDAYIARVLQIPRTLASSLCKDSQVQVNGRTISKSLKIKVGDQLVVTIPPQADPLEIKVEKVEELKIIADDDDYVVIDKPVGVAAHPSPGWVGPTVVGALMSEGYNITTSGAAERQGIVHRLDVGTSGLMVVAK